MARGQPLPTRAPSSLSWGPNAAHGQSRPQNTAHREIYWSETGKPPHVRGRWYAPWVSHHFVRALERIAADNPHAAVLLSQWHFDKTALAQSLGSVVYTFPHYSRHDHSHADEILVKIYRILGDARLSRLSATNIWLLLEAAYSHDIGMVIDDTTARAWVKSPDYRRFLDVVTNGGDDLAEAARRLEEQSYEHSATWALDVRRDLVSVFAEYARREHARRAEHVILTPEGIGLQSPRTSHVPPRLWKVLARICRGHGETFEEVMSIPFREAGLGADHCHPRFVACMLRLGDLLDLDNGRFCDTMLSAFGEPLAATRAHLGKHASIEHLDVDSNTIEVTAHCKSYEEYEATEGWFDMLRSELAQQASRWAHIAPDGDFGSLPSMGKVSASLREVKLLLLASNKRPRFTVDRDAVMALIRGNKLYSDPVVWIRELLQNSIDATLLRIYSDDPLAASAPPSSPLTWLQEQFRRYPIRVEFRRLEQPDIQHIHWKVRVVDQGVGISKDDLRYLQTIGSSSLNPARRRFRREMPEWMWPSGIFGIGLQSVFMAADAITITSHHAQSSEAFRIKIEKSKSPYGRAGDLIFIEEIPYSRLRVGCELSFDWLVPKIAERASFESRLLRDFDGCTDQDLPELIERACAAIDQVRGATFAQIVLETSIDTASPSSRDPLPTLEHHWAKEYNVDVTIRRVAASMAETLRFDYHYRGMEIAKGDRSRIRLPLLDRLWISFDIFWGSARDLLNVERNEFTQDMADEIDRRSTLAAIQAVVSLKKHALAEHTAMLSLVLKCLCQAWDKNCLPPFFDFEDSDVRRLMQDASQLAGDEFRRCEVGKGLTISDCLDAGSILITNDFLSERSEKSTEVGTYIKVLPAPGSRGRSAAPGGSRWLRANSGADQALFLLSNTTAVEKVRSRGRVLRLGFEKTPIGSGVLENDEIMIWTLEHMFSDRLRNYLPCPARFSALAVNARPSWAWPIGFLPGMFVSSFKAFPGRRIMICPFNAVSGRSGSFALPSVFNTKIFITHLSAMLEWTWLHRADSSVTRSQIADALNDFITYADRLMSGRWEVSYDLSAAREEVGSFIAAPQPDGGDT